MKISEACAAIEAILAAIPDEQLPQFDYAEINGGETTVWYGGCGRVLGSARVNGERNPSYYRKQAAWSAIEMEMTYRADTRYFKNGDKPDGIRLAKKNRKA